MATIDDHKELAFTALRRFVQPDTEPTLSDPELNAVLDSVQRATFWASATVYVYGDVISPVTKNGHRFRCIQGGTTATTEPTWPKRNASVITDGTVQWQEAGADFDNVFDVRAAAHQAWLMKSAKASVLVDQGNVKYSQIAERCETMALSFEPINFA